MFQGVARALTVGVVLLMAEYLPVHAQLQRVPRNSQRPARTLSACEVASVAEIAKATGVTVKNGTEGRSDPATAGQCTWLGADSLKIVLTLEDVPHMRATIATQQQQGGMPVSDLGLKAVENTEAGFPYDTFVISVLDGDGGFSIRFEGKGASQARAIALAKQIESRR